MCNDLGAATVISRAGGRTKPQAKLGRSWNAEGAGEYSLVIFIMVLVPFICSPIAKRYN